MAEGRIGGASAYQTGIPLAHGGAFHRTERGIIDSGTFVQNVEFKKDLSARGGVVFEGYPHFSI